jgi:tRNA1(Val) A37 N6-methylase TrmN6
MATANRDVLVKRLSAFYTPASLADMLADWLVQTGSERILEPSVGEGALVDAALRSAARLSNSSKLRFTACDINPEVIDKLARRLGERSEARAVDFLQLDPASTGLFDAVLANPPFTRNHDLDPRRRAILRDKFEATGAAGLWVHFLIHAVEFLRPGGRLAFVIPASALFSDYGRVVLERMASRFAAVEIREIVDRPTWINGADERGALLLAEGFASGTSTLPDPRRWSAAGLPAKRLPLSAAYERLLAASTTLDEIASLSIGAVTGCNKVFLLSESERRALAIHKADLTPVVSRARQIRGLSIDNPQLHRLATIGEKTWLLTPRHLGKKGSGIRRRLAQISARRRADTLWFTKRTPWWKVDAERPSDAIFTYMNDRGPRLVLVVGDVHCTNTLHCVRFREGTTRDQQLTASLTLISTFGQLAAERLGRIYGGGLLKFELKDARAFPMLPAQAGLEQAFEAADTALCEGKLRVAERIANEALLAPLLGPDWQAVTAELRAEIDARRELRRGEV